MSFDAEWAQHKAAVLAGQQSPAMRLNQVAPEVSGSPGSLLAGAGSINGNANLLIEIAALLHEGRPDGDASTMARAPRAHADVSKEALRFARFADDQFKDTISLFAALATRLKTTGTSFAHVDDDTARSFLNNLLESGQYVPPECK
ncbi:MULTISPECIES: hypothetical protein [unclassified Streptomyces]|uniref:hypothetical protein n=1 Tax=unclassified Streptomyces TaxID=2593676 RepID=UPI00224E52F8|nr:MULTISPECIES: hypothetical protein [unclassified Streptomyces]MCX5607391.1 hypothetical protein [Streptomyces sp. NBC_00047]